MVANLPPSIETDKLRLAQAVAAYLPEVLVANLLQPAPFSPISPDNLNNPSYFEAVTMMVDVTGFTPLCEALAKKGREGAEQVTELINAFFKQALAGVQEQGGVIAKFGGDAFNAFFVRQPDQSWDELIGRALQSAFTLQALVLDYKAIRLPTGADGQEQLFQLAVKVGLGAGLVLTFGVGLPASHRDFQAAGLPFNYAVEAEHHAQRGEIIVHEELLKRVINLRDCLELGAARENCYPVQALNMPHFEPLAPIFSLTARDLEPFLAQAITFLPPAIYERIKLGYSSLPGEHRRVISLFVNFTGFDWISDPEAPANFQNFYLTVSAVVERYNGNLNRISSGDKGDLLHIFFGAPVTYQDDEEQAVRCALALLIVAHRFSFIKSLKVGLSSGFVFAGDIGSPTRHEYTIIGDTVNLSARLMQMAQDGTVLVDANTVSRLPKGFEFAPFRAVQLKGKQGFIQVCEVVRAVEAEEVTHPAEQPLYGREQELAVAFEVMQASLQGESHILAVHGEPGIGKSSLLGRITHEWESRGGGICSTTLLNYERGAFKLWAKWLAQFFGLDNHSTLEMRQAQVNQRVAELVPDLREWSPLWGELLDLEMPEPAWLRSLDRATRRLRLAEYTPRLLAAAAQSQPLLLGCDDFHLVDGASLELLEQVVPQLKTAKVLLCFGYRTEQTPPLALLTGSLTQTIALQALSVSASEQMVLAALTEVQASATDRERFIVAVNDMTGGNPFFIEELISTLRAEELLEAAIRGAGNSAPLSYNLQSLIMARLDALDGQLREIVLAASVAGGYFSDQLLKPLLPPAVAQALENEAFAPLEQLYRLDLLRPQENFGRPQRVAPTNDENGVGVAPSGYPPPYGVYRFRHALIQQVAYDSLPFSRRRVLHEEVAHYFEVGGGAAEDKMERLTYHYERSNNHPKAVFYLAQSAKRSARLFANTEALQQYQTALARAQTITTVTEPTVPELLQGLGDVQAINDFGAALESYAKALEQLAEGAIFERTVLEQRRARVLKEATRFPEALQALERAEQALTALPSAQARVKLAQSEIAELYSTIILRQNKFDEALQWAERGLKLLEGMTRRQEGAVLAKVKLYQAIASIAPMLRRMDKAEESLSKALRLVKKLEEPLTESALQLRLAILTMQRDQYRKAAPYFRRALPMTEKTKTPSLIAHVLLPGGQTFMARGEFGLAREWLERGLKLAEEVGTPWLVCSGLYLLAWLDKDCGEWDRAITSLEASISIAENHGLWTRLVEYLMRQGEILANQGEYAAADKLFQQAMRYAEERKLNDLLLMCNRFLAEVYYRRGLYQEAAECLQRGKVGGSSEFSVNKAMSHLRLAEWAALSRLSGATVAELAPLAEIRIQATTSLDFLKRCGCKQCLPFAYRVNGLLEWSQNCHAEAASYFKKGLTVARATGNQAEVARLLVERNRLTVAQGGRLNRVELKKAATLFEYMGAQPDLDKVRKLLG